jgi:hypothetical protein
MASRINLSSVRVDPCIKEPRLKVMETRAPNESDGRAKEPGYVFAVSVI